MPRLVIKMSSHADNIERTHKLIAVVGKLLGFVAGGLLMQQRA